MISRRDFAVSLSGAWALVGGRALAQRSGVPKSAATEVVSKATGAVISFPDTDYDVIAQDFDRETASEVIVLGNDHTELTISFYRSGQYETLDDAVEAYYRQAEEIYDSVQKLGGSTSEAATWVAMLVEYQGYPKALYYEFQADAFEGYDVDIEAFDDPDLMQQSIDEIQTIDFDGFPPFLYLDESGADTPGFFSTAGGTGGGRRSGRNTTPKADGNTEQPQKTQPTAEGKKFVETLRSEHERVISSINKSTELAKAGGDPAPVVQIAMQWLVYPDFAATVSIPKGYEDLGELYLEWARAVGNLGQGYMNMANNITAIVQSTGGYPTEYQIQQANQPWSNAVAEFSQVEARFVSALERAEQDLLA